jgi:uncharacterized membrane protein
MGKTYTEDAIKSLGVILSTIVFILLFCVLNHIRNDRAKAHWISVNQSLRRSQRLIGQTIRLYGAGHMRHACTYIG